MGERETASANLPRTTPLKMQRFMKTNGQPLPLDILPEITKVIYMGKYHEEVRAARLWCCAWLKAEDLMKPDGLAAGLRSVSWIKSNTGVGDSKAPVLFGGSLGMLDLKYSSNDTPDLGRVRHAMEQMRDDCSLPDVLGTIPINAATIGDDLIDLQPLGGHAEIDAATLILYWHRAQPSTLARFRPSVKNLSLKHISEPTRPY